ncbi:hypothetical protein [Desulfitobacterium dehalogenans]|uniref:hypothetical protein n=1 Tax=Desulfitobacterium dehalogenans TaxID=36854 RepID=UPI0002497CCA|nr:hypothetical protein [Desulfitobacterium dehalogenans]
MCEQPLYLRPIEDGDIALLEKWLNKPYILRWYEDPAAWIDEIEQRNGSFAFINHFIVMDGSRSIGFCHIMTAIKREKSGILSATLIKHTASII